LLRLFSRSPDSGGQPATAFLWREGASIRRHAAKSDFETSYVIKLVLAELTKRCRELDLRVARAPHDVRSDLTDLVDRMLTEFRRMEHVVAV
jgi:hypothetical protein